jgi:phosphohistidine phosphatase
VTGEARNRTLVLLRHARADHHGGVTDEMRALNATGRRQAVHVGHALAAGGLVPDVVLCSISVRTRQTYELLAGSLGVRPPAEYLEDLYHAGIADVLAVVGAVPEEARTVLVVGHEPVMSATASVLAGPGSDPTALSRVRVGVPTGAYSVLTLRDPWNRLNRGGAVLTQLVTPHHH